jgi:hypothetical protein
LKLQQYTGGPFADLQCMFLNALRHTDLLLVCGYGYGDRGINHKIFDYCYDAVGKTFAALGRDLSVLQSDPRYQRSRANCFYFPCKIENVSWLKIKESILNSENTTN